MYQRGQNVVALSYTILEVHAQQEQKRTLVYSSLLRQYATYPYGQKPVARPMNLAQ